MGLVATRQFLSLGRNANHRLYGLVGVLGDMGQRNLVIDLFRKAALDVRSNEVVFDFNDLTKNTVAFCSCKTF